MRQANGWTFVLTIVASTALAGVFGLATAGAAHDWGSIAVTLLGPPVAVDDNLTTKQNTQGTAFVLDNDGDPDGDDLLVLGNTDPPHGTAVCDQFGQCNYTPDTGYLGSDSFDYTVSDGNGGTDVGRPRQRRRELAACRRRRHADDEAEHAGHRVRARQRHRHER